MTVQPHAHNSSPFFLPKHAKGRFEANGQSFEIEIQTPDLNSVQKRLWGDWGPMYTCTLPADQQFVVRYHCETLGKSSACEFSPPTVGVHSPARVDERARHPLYLEVDDMARNLRIRVYMDETGTPDQLEAMPLCAGMSAAELIFRDGQTVSAHATVVGSP